MMKAGVYKHEVFDIILEQLDAHRDDHRLVWPYGLRQINPDIIHGLIDARLWSLLSNQLNTLISGIRETKT